MTKDEELKEAREWWIREQNLLYDLNKEQVEFVSGEAAKMLIDYHHHRLDTAWVSVKDKPMRRGHYLAVVEWVISETGEGGQYVESVFFNNDIWHTNYEYETVVFWQPLPEPPKETV